MSAPEVTFGDPEEGIFMTYVPVLVDGKKVTDICKGDDALDPWYTYEDDPVGTAAGGDWKTLEEAKEAITKGIQE